MNAARDAPGGVFKVGGCRDEEETKEEDPRPGAAPTRDPGRTEAMRRASAPLQELPAGGRGPVGGRGPALRANKRKLRGPDWPQEPACWGKENLLLPRRSRRRRDSVCGVSLDHLPDELLLRVLLCLPLQDLVRTSAVSTRWRRLAWDECLWRSVDLEGLVQVGPALRRVLRTGVRRLRCPRVFLEEPHFPHLSCLQLVQMDLSNSSIPTPALESIIGGCRLLEFLSLEGLQLSDAVLTSLSENRRLLQLNLSGCSGFSAAALLRLLAACCRVQQLNVSWCSFSSQHVKTLVQHLSPSVTHLNLSGYRENLTLEDVKVLVSRCPNLETLDLSDSTLLTADCFQVLKQLRFLVHLSLSRCYQIHLAALSDLGRTLPSLGLLDVFGVVPPGRLAALGEEVPGVCVNATPFSSVARPTPAGGPADRAMWSRGCQLRFRP